MWEVPCPGLGAKWEWGADRLLHEQRREAEVSVSLTLNKNQLSVKRRDGCCVCSA